MKILVTFRSKNQAMLYSNMLYQNGVKNRVINTPRFLSVSCGLSVEVDMIYITKAKETLKGYAFDSLGGVYAINKNGTFDNIKL